jgi:hypothetical protein
MRKPAVSPAPHLVWRRCCTYLLNPRMKKIAHFEQVGFKFEKWVDVGYWQAVL